MAGVNDRPGIDRHIIENLDNASFLAAHAAPGRIGLAGGGQLVERVIRRAQSHLRDDRSASPWSHAFLIGNRREDDRHWVFESDLDVRRGQIRLGVQENRLDKYHDERSFANLAVIDLGLDARQTTQVLTAALDLLAMQTRYSLTELIGTLLAMRHPTLRSRENLLAKDGAVFCSAMVQHCFAAAGIDLCPGVSRKNTTPEDLATLTRPHRAWILTRSTTLPPLAPGFRRRTGR